ncbi:MAG TPA: histidine kinase [Flavitalea sp.]|nr:histidine kinase [Flavitalea sp.]
MKNLHDIIFTDRFPDKLLRHILFWIGQFLFWAIMTASFFINMSKLQYLANDLRLHTFFLPDIFYTYVVSYYLVNRFLAKGRNTQFVVALISVTLFTYVLFLLLRLRDYNMFDAPGDVMLRIIWTYTIKFTSLGPPVICAMFLSLKFLKNYHRKTEENKMLISENTRSQLGQLKAQIHPHFLFNTLSNIHSFAMTKPEVAGELVSKLSDTMKYMIYECEATHVDLGKELKMIGDYTTLQSVRYSNALKMRINITGDCRDKKIAPLFLVPLIENAFKHGTSQVLNDPWIDVDITIKHSSLLMHLSNCKPSVALAAGFRSGIGLNNVRKRLELIYPGDHRFNITSTDNSFSVEIEFPILNVAEAAAVDSDKSFTFSESVI